MNKLPFKHFDLPRQHLTGKHFFPARTRDRTEAERRGSLPPGTLLLEQQRDGTKIAGNIMRIILDDPRDKQFVARTLGTTGLNTSWYGFAQGAEVQRRVLPLPERATVDDPEWLQTPDGLWVMAQKGLDRAALNSGSLVTAKTHNLSTDRHRKLTGRATGSAALNLLAMDMGVAPLASDPFEVQAATRLHLLEALEEARNLASHIGVHPSMAQLADPDSPLAVHWRREAPDGAYHAYEQAYEEFRTAA